MAINFPETLRQGLWSATESLRSGALPVRWVKPEAMHLTLKFLGDLAAERQDELAGALRRAAASSRAVTVTVADFGAFPDPRRPRVLWAGVSPEPALELLQHQVEQAEAYVRGLGVTGDLRVRHLGAGARVEVGPEWIAWLAERLPDVTQRLQALGFSAVEIDPRGYRRGSLILERHAAP